MRRFRSGIGVDINPAALAVAYDRLQLGTQRTLNGNSIPPYKDRMGLERAVADTKQRLYLGDARNLDLVEDNSVGLIATHPPYVNIIGYTSENEVQGDISLVKDVDSFCREMYLVAKECFRVLRTGGYCCILIGDTRRRTYYVNISDRVLVEFLRAGFALKESVVKRQWNCTATGFWWKKSIKENFLLIMHENLYVMRKM